ncbi:MAG: N-acetylmuramoyl-L-alanine amidase [Bacillota bacterium]|nr:N-acetylmuramoyl-L-alanine amidase [Bacillota bacterium]
MAKVFLGVGHGGSDPGAVGYIKEADVNLSMALACRDYLQVHGVEVKMSRTKDENDPLSEEIRECNAFNPDYAVDIHNNAGGGDGFEVIHTLNGGKGKILAQNIEAEVKAIGQNSRGLKTKANSSGNDYFGFIRSIKAPSVIVEGVFVDNAADAAQADTQAEQAAFGVAYAKGILKTLNIPYQNDARKSEWVQDSTGWWYRHADGSYTTNNWEKINGNWYYFDSSGYMYTEGWHKIGGYWYYMDKWGAMQTGWVYVNGNWFYLKADGAMANNEWYKDENENWYWLKEGGYMAGDELVWIGNEMFYFMSDGHMAHTNDRGALV